MFVHAAIASNAKWLVTGDLDLLVLKKVDTVRIITPAEAMDMERFPLF